MRRVFPAPLAILFPHKFFLCCLLVLIGRVIFSLALLARKRNDLSHTKTPSKLLKDKLSLLPKF